ncbi:MAG: hypothetical protein JO257_06765 [Deltaproteobacteria bacterium]|nr:hypothetical protein [Deltaproteobacteria bacterium]
MRSLLILSIAAGALCILAATAHAGHADPVVLAVDGGNIYVDLGAKDGVGAGSKLELLHEVVAKDPRTGAILKDHFALGTLVVDRAGDSIAVAHADKDLVKRILAGDNVRLISSKKHYVDPWIEAVAASKANVIPPSAPGGPDHAALARQAWQDTLGLPPEQRIERWQKLLADDPDTQYRKSVEGEIGSLQGQIRAREAAIEAAKHTAPEGRSVRVVDLAAAIADGNDALVIAPIDRAVPDHDIELAFLERVPVGKAWLFAKPTGAAGYTRTVLRQDGDAYLRGTIAAALVTGERVDWYVEDETAQRLANGAIAIDRPVIEPPPQPHRSHVDMHVDYVDFDGRLNKGFDQYYLAEADFQYRFLDPIYAVRLGFGTLSGTGGPKDVINADPNGCVDGNGVYRCRHVEFTYVYTEFEHELRPSVHVMVRPQVGHLTTDTMPGSDGSRCHGRDVTGCELATGFGAKLGLRLGDEQGTNLAIGAAFTQHVGTLLEAAYHWLPAPQVPVQVMVQVTDEPVPQDFGVRLIGDVGYHAGGWFYPSVRVSYQARDINHAGFSGGAAMNFDW